MCGCVCFSGGKGVILIGLAFELKSIKELMNNRSPDAFGLVRTHFFRLEILHFAVKIRLTSLVTGQKQIPVNSNLTWSTEELVQPLVKDQRLPSTLCHNYEHKIKKAIYIKQLQHLTSSSLCSLAIPANL